LGRGTFDYDHDWTGTEQVAVDVVKSMADKDLGFAGRDDEVWFMLDAEARDRGGRPGSSAVRVIPVAPRTEKPRPAQRRVANRPTNGRF
jgi:hypothetical protein